MKLGKIMIFVSDLSEAKRFYCDVLGFPLAEETEKSLSFIHQGCDFIAFKCAKESEIKDYSQTARSVFVFEVASIDETFAELKNKGVEFLHGEPAENEFSRYAALRDSFGNVHEIYESKVKK